MADEIGGTIAAIRGDRDELLELVGDNGRGGVQVCFRRDAIQTGQQGQAQAIVLAAAFAPGLTVAPELVDLAVDRARHQIVGEAATREQQRRSPGELEGPALGAVAKRVGGLPRHSGSLGGIADDAPFGERVEENGDPFGRPAVLALVVAWARVPARGEDLIDKVRVEKTGRAGVRLVRGFQGQRRRLGGSGCVFHM